MMTRVAATTTAVCAMTRSPRCDAAAGSHCVMMAEIDPSGTLQDLWTPPTWWQEGYDRGLCSCDAEAALICEAYPSHASCEGALLCPYDSTCKRPEEIWGLVCPITGPCFPVASYDGGLCVPREIAYELESSFELTSRFDLSSEMPAEVRVVVDGFDALLREPGDGLLELACAIEEQESVEGGAVRARVRPTAGRQPGSVGRWRHDRRGVSRAAFGRSGRSIRSTSTSWSAPRCGTS